MGKLIFNKNLILNPYFIFGLFLKIIIIFFIFPTSIQEWFLPFLNQPYHNQLMNPWKSWLESGGSINAFPYGFGMYLLFKPAFLAFNFFELEVKYLYQFLLLIIDFVILLFFPFISNFNSKKVVLFYWLSPIIIVATYILGFNDIVILFLIFLCLYFIKQKKYFLAGFFIAFACSSKLSIVLIIPFFFYYIFNNRNLRKYFIRFALGFSIASIFFLIPSLLLNESVKMIVGSNQVNKIFTLNFELNKNLYIFVLPIFYLLLNYFVWRLRRINFNMLYVLIGLIFFVTAMLTPLSPGWFILSVGLFTYYQLKSDNTSIIIVSLFNCFYLLIVYLNNISKSFLIHSYINSIIFTLFIGLGLILIFRIYRQLIFENNFYKISRYPYLIGICGDSGSGKDYFSNALANLFGRNATSMLTGDNYHLWERNSSVWKLITPLNPNGNNLEAYSNDLLNLKNGITVEVNQYNHNLGKNTGYTSINPNDFIISSGLHTLFNSFSRDLLNLSIFLDMNDKLRKFYKMKRDIYERNYSKKNVFNALKKRAYDSKKFINPQKQYANLIFKIQPLYPAKIKFTNLKYEPQLKLNVTSRLGLNEHKMAKILMSICNLNVNFDNTNDISEVIFTIDGDVTADDLKVAANILCTDINELINDNFNFNPGITGVMQLIVLNHINQSLKK